MQQPALVGLAPEIKPMMMMMMICFFSKMNFLLFLLGGSSSSNCVQSLPLQRSENGHRQA